MSPATGRRPGRPDTRETILEAARALFADVGFERASIRGIARRASVDPALVHHYFGTKTELLAAAIELPVDVAGIVDGVFRDPTTVGANVARTVLRLWDQPEVNDRLVGMLRSAVTHPAAAETLRAVLVREALGPVAQRVEAGDPELRAELCATQLIGIAVARYVLKMEPLASVAIDAVAAAVGPTLQRYLTDPNLLRSGHPSAARRQTPASGGSLP